MCLCFQVRDPLFSLAAYWAAAKAEWCSAALQVLKEKLLAAHRGVDRRRFGEVADAILERSNAGSSRNSRSQAREGPAAKRLRVAAVAAGAAVAASRRRQPAVHASASSASSSSAADELLRRTRADDHRAEEWRAAAVSPSPPPKAQVVGLAYVPLAPAPEGWQEYCDWKAAQLAPSGRAPLPGLDYTRFL
jgi:hypothetical protein